MLKSRSTIKSNFRNAKILVVEDMPDQWVLIKNAIEQCLPEVEPILVSNESEALAYLENCTRDEWILPKLILLDLYLPTREEGWQTLEHIRTLPAPVCYTPVVMFSNSNKPEDITDSYKRGISCYLVKPLLFEQWLEYFRALRTYWLETIALPNLNFVY